MKQKAVFKKINKINKPLVRLTKLKKEKTKITDRNKRGCHYGVQEDNKDIS